MRRGGSDLAAARLERRAHLGHLLLREAEAGEEDEREHEAVIEEARRRGVGVLVKKALASGRVGTGGAAGALKFVLSHAGVSCAVVGTTSPANLASNCDAVEAWEGEQGALGKNP